MSQDCPDCASQARSGATKEEPKEEIKEEDAQIKQVTTEELVNLVRNIVKALQGLGMLDVSVKL